MRLEIGSGKCGLTQPISLSGGAKGFTTHVTEIALQPNGQWRYVMVGPDGTEYPVKGVFREVVPLERIVTTDEFDTGFKPAIDADLPQGIVRTVLFEDLGDRTKVILQIEHETIADRRQHEVMGGVGEWNSSLDCMENYLGSLISRSERGLTLTLPSDREILVTRAFNAPRHLVWQAWT